MVPVYKSKSYEIMSLKLLFLLYRLSCGRDCSFTPCTSRSLLIYLSNLKRLQFPIKVPFAITINKAQPRTFKYVKINLCPDYFSGRQLYVGLIKNESKSEIQFILLLYGTQKTENVVYSEIL